MRHLLNNTRRTSTYICREVNICWLCISDLRHSAILLIKNDLKVTRSSVKGRESSAIGLRLLFSLSAVAFVKFIPTALVLKTKIVDVLDCYFIWNIMSERPHQFGVTQMRQQQPNLSLHCQWCIFKINGETICSIQIQHGLRGSILLFLRCWLTGTTCRREAEGGNTEGTVVSTTSPK